MYILNTNTIKKSCNEILKSRPEDAEKKALNLITTLSINNETDLLKLTKQLLGKSLFTFYSYMAIDKLKRNI